MELIIVLMLIAVLAFAGKAADKTAKDTQREIIKEIKKVCPPHKWFYQEIKDHEGVVHATKIVCEHCGPLKPMGEPSKMDY